MRKEDKVTIEQTKERGELPKNTTGGASCRVNINHIEDHVQKKCFYV